MITSRDNPHLKHARAVRKGIIPDMMFLEGLRLCEEAVRSGIEVAEALHTSDLALDRRGKALLGELKQQGISTLLVPITLLGSVTDTKSPQGIVMLARKPASDRQALSQYLSQDRGDLKLIILLHKMNNPANLGAILRTAEAAGAAGIIVTKNSADPFSPKALRGAMGANLRMPIWYGVEFNEAVEYCRLNEMLITCADVTGDQSYTEIDWQRPRALVIGSEAHGLGEEELAICDDSFRIPMAGPVESLNAAVAAGIVLFEARRVAAI